MSRSGGGGGGGGGGYPADRYVTLILNCMKTNVILCVWGGGGGVYEPALRSIIKKKRDGP